jgi:single-stranded-DNA-specific exonuclease
MNKHLILSLPDEKIVRSIQKNNNCSQVFATILVNRGIETKKAIQKFLSPSLNDLRSFDQLTDMDKAVFRIADAILKKEKILVFGDYDVDGITATTILYEFLKAAGANTDYYIPHRIDEGYSLNNTHIENFAIPEKINLIITIDCGISSHQAVNCANKAGIDVIITDHHLISEALPKAIAVINPKRNDCLSKSDYLAGVGVAFCLLISLRKHLRKINYWQKKPEPNLMELIDLVAIGTIADIVPLVNENRILTKAGLEIINSHPRPGITALMNASGMLKPLIDTESVSFYIAPRLNAAGRMDHAKVAVELLSTRDPEKAATIAKTVNEFNNKRKEIEQKIFQLILLFFKQEPDNLKKKAIVLGDDRWHEGVLGIVASRLAEKYFKPVILISFNGESGKGSARSIPGINMYKALDSCSEFLDDFGGHPMAAGIKIKKENMKKFRIKFEQVVEEMKNQKQQAPVLKIDCQLNFDMITDQLLNEIENLQPFGEMNPEPLFCTENIQVIYSKQVGKNHLKLTLRQAGLPKDKTINAIWFNVDNEAQKTNFYKKIAYRLRWNHWNGRKKIQAIIEYP